MREVAAPRPTRRSAAAGAAALLLSLLASLPGCRVVEPAGVSRLPELPTLHDELHLDRSVRVPAGVYRLDDRDRDGLIHIVADDVTLDLTGVVLIVADLEGTPPHERTGRAIRAEGVERFRLIGGTIRGAKVGVEVIGGSGHSIERTRFDEGFRQRLRSTPDAEHAGDWLWPHENDDDEWTKRYGAAVHLKLVDDAVVRDVEVRRTQNGIILSRSSEVRVEGCDASYLSGWGLALWRTCDSHVHENRFDFCVRGYSHGVYDRGQDSSGILVFEQCSRNTFTDNRARFGGDGFFLFAGNDTLKRTGGGGCNDNVVTGNDFSFAVANAIEATFSRGNLFAGNRLEGSNYAVWAGYSSETTIAANQIGGNRLAGIAIEHGRDNILSDNHFAIGHGPAIRLWWDPDHDLAATSFGRKHDTNSVGNQIDRNYFAWRDAPEISLHDADLTFIGLENQFDIRDRDREDFLEKGLFLEQTGRGVVKPNTVGIPATGMPLHPPSHDPDFATRRAAIFIGEWGPYDGEGIGAWPQRLDGVAAGRVHLFGPGLPYRIDAIGGPIEVTPASGVLPATVTVRPRDGARGFSTFTFVAMTEEGEITVRGSLLTLPWEVSYHAWEPAGDHTPPRDWDAVRASAPLHTETRTDLDLRFGGGGPTEERRDHFATVAQSTFTVPAGEYSLSITSDDGVRVRLDGETIHDDWTWHPPRTETIDLRLTDRAHTIEVEHFEIDGNAVLQVRLTPRLAEDLR